MLAYWLLFLLPACLAITQPRPVHAQPLRWSGFWRVAFLILLVTIGLRHEVGTDWEAYAEHVRRAGYDSLQDAVLHGDPAYSLLNWLAAQTDLGPYFVNTAGAALFAWGLVAFCRVQPRPWLTLVVAVPYLVIVVAMGYTRQGIAIGLVLLGLVSLSGRKIFYFITFVVLAAAFHKSAVILMPLAVLAGAKRRIWTAVWVGLATLIFYILLLQESVEGLKSAYIEAEYASGGAAIRVAMNAVPAVLFLLFRRRFDMRQSDRIFWSWMSLGALLFIGVLVFSPSSTAVDRVALYWIPLQLFVLPRLPDALGQRNGSNTLWVCVVEGYSASVLFVWLFFADNAYAWVPYKFYPLVLIGW